MSHYLVGYRAFSVPCGRRAAGLRRFFMRRIWVCTSDRVLAKRVRFLLARDDRKVDVAEDASALEAWWSDGSGGACDLLIISGGREGRPAAEQLPQAVRHRPGPPILVLGGTRSDAEDERLHVVEDPSNPQAIVALAAELLERGPDAAHPRRETEQKMNNPPDSRPPRPAEAREAVDSGAADPASLARRFYVCANRRLTGRLEVTTPDETLTYAILEGRPVHARSSQPGDRFGRWLVERGRITDATYAAASKHAVEHGAGLGASLVATEALTEAELSQHRADHARNRLIESFGAAQAHFRFFEGGAPGERSFDLDVLPVVAEGFKRHADDDLVQSIMADKAARYFKIRRAPERLGELFNLDRDEVEMLRFGGRAYNPADAAELSGLPFRDALKLMALLWTCDEVEDFTPGVGDFEARIHEEKERARESRSLDVARSAPSLEDEPAPLPLDPPMVTHDEVPSASFSFEHDEVEEELEPLSAVEETALLSHPPPPPEPTPTPLPFDALEEHLGEPEPAPYPAPESAPSLGSWSSRPAPPPGVEVPPMPVPAPHHEGRAPAPLLWAAPAARGPDGALLETPERAQSREFFQQGVQLLGQGQFDAAEQSFREAISLCAEEPVYLIGLGRAIFYNPTYSADGKIPLLRTIVDRAERLSPNDGRVMDLRNWVEHAPPSPV